jgi:predicted nuclease of predicted toxin-antitoxin system
MDVGLGDATDTAIFPVAPSADVAIMSKDAGFVGVVERRAAPPDLIWLTCGNVTNRRRQTVLTTSLREALALVQCGRSIVAITDPPV